MLQVIKKQTDIQEHTHTHTQKQLSAEQEISDGHVEQQLNT